MLSFSAHKMRGSQGIGGLVLRKRSYKLPPVQAIMCGGQQERGLRPGIIPTALAAGCGAACALAETNYAEDARKLREIEAFLLGLIGASGLRHTIHGDPRWRMPNTLSLCLHGISSEALMIATKQYCAVSNGSACTSTNYAPSYVLTAMGLPADQIESTIRISWGADTDADLLKAEFSKLLDAARELAQ